MMLNSNTKHCVSLSGAFLLWLWTVMRMTASWLHYAVVAVVIPARRVVSMHQGFFDRMRIDQILDFYTFIPFLQDVQSVNEDGLCTGNRGFGF